MKALITDIDKKEWSVKDVPLPSTTHGDILPVIACGICGSDLLKWLKEWPDKRAVPADIWGHEMVVEGGNSEKQYSGVIPFFGCDECTECLNGRPYLCATAQALGKNKPGGFAEFVSVKPSLLRSLPFDFPVRLGVLADAAAVVRHTIRVLQMRCIVDKVLIIGDGPIAFMLSLMIYDIFGIYPTLAIQNLSRISLASELGIRVINWPGVAAQPSNYNCVVDCTGGNNSSRLEAAIELTRPGGSIIVVGVYANNTKYTVNWRRLFYKEVILFGINSYATGVIANDFQDAIEWLVSKRSWLTYLPITEIPLSEMDRFLYKIRDSKERFFKVIVNCKS